MNFKNKHLKIFLIVFCFLISAIIGGLILYNIAQAQSWTSNLSVCANSASITGVPSPGVYNVSFDWSWDTFAKPGTPTNTLDCPANFRIQVDDSADFSSPVLDRTTTAINPYTTSLTLSRDVTYYWRIRIYTNRGVTGGYSIWTDWANGPNFQAPYIDIKANGSDGPLNLYYPAVTLSWSSKEVTSCAASGDWSGSKAVSGTETLNLERGTSNPGSGRTFNFTLTCRHTPSGTTLSDTVTVILWQIPQCSFSANPTAIILPQISTLSWSCSYANTCSINQGVGSVNPVSGSQEVRPPETTTYTLTCDGSDGTRTWQSTVNVGFTPRLREVIPR